MIILLLIFAIILIYIIVHYNILRYIHINLDPYCKFSLKKFEKIPRINKKGKVIISMTTVPGRIEFTKYSIASLLDQTRRVDEIRIYIPYISSKGVLYVIPKWMSDLSKNIKHFKIKRCEKDWGPATKIIPAVLECVNEEIDSIIYVDDDMIYNKNMVETLIFYSKKYPHYAICNQGWNVDRWLNKTTSFSKILHHFRKYFIRIDPYHNNFIDVVQGFSGVLIKPSFFNINELININKYPSEVFFVDDVYLSGLLNNNNVKRISTEIQVGIPFWSEFFNGFLLRRAKYSLSSEQNRDLVNDKIASNCFKWVKQFITDLPKKYVNNTLQT